MIGRFNLPVYLDIAIVAAVVMVFWDHPVLGPWAGGVFIATGLVQSIKLAVRARRPRVGTGGGRWTILNAAISSVGLAVLGAGQVWELQHLDALGLILAVVPFAVSRIRPRSDSEVPTGSA